MAPAIGYVIHFLDRADGTEASPDEYFAAGYGSVEKRPIDHERYTHELTLDGQTYYAVMYHNVTHKLARGVRIEVIP
jgi:hypothetical protein